MPDQNELAHRMRMQNILAWIRTAKENLPAISQGAVSTDRVVSMSALLDRLHVEAMRRKATIDRPMDLPDITPDPRDQRRKAA